VRDPSSRDATLEKHQGEVALERYIKKVSGRRGGGERSATNFNLKGFVKRNLGESRYGIRGRNPRLRRMNSIMVNIQYMREKKKKKIDRDLTLTKKGNTRCQGRKLTPAAEEKKERTESALRESHYLKSGRGNSIIGRKEHRGGHKLGAEGEDVRTVSAH